MSPGGLAEDTYAIVRSGTGTERPSSGVATQALSIGIRIVIHPTVTFLLSTGVVEYRHVSVPRLSVRLLVYVMLIL